MLFWNFQIFTCGNAHYFGNPGFTLKAMLNFIEHHMICFENPVNYIENHVDRFEKHVNYLENHVNDNDNHVKLH